MRPTFLLRRRPQGAGTRNRYGGVLRSIRRSSSLKGIVNPTNIKHYLNPSQGQEIGGKSAKKRVTAAAAMAAAAAGAAMAKAGRRPMIMHGLLSKSIGRAAASKRFHNHYYHSNSNGSGKRKVAIAAARNMKWWAAAAPVVVLCLVAAIHQYRKRQQKRGQGGEQQQEKKPIRPAGPWQVFIYSTLPLKAASRLWGRVNEMQLPIWARTPGFKLYSKLFGVDLNEIADPDLCHYKNLAEFFYRELKPGARPIDSNAEMVSPADGKILHLGVIKGREIEQVKGMTYSLDALLGNQAQQQDNVVKVAFDKGHKYPQDYETLQQDKDFAVVNGITYTLSDLLGHSPAQGKSDKHHHHHGEEHISKLPGDASSQQGQSLLDKEGAAEWASERVDTAPKDRKLFFAVIYLAPGDYHRFHSPTNWVVELRRHFTGELYSVAPYFQTRLANLFVLNERVALLGRWKHGFFSMTPVGATNVGSIIVNFDKYLKTNTYYAPAQEKEESEIIIKNSSSRKKNKNKKTKEKSNTCYEASYAKASPILHGLPLQKGQEMGGFNLGSTVVLVFEAPNYFDFNVRPGQHVRVGQALAS